MIFQQKVVYKWTEGAHYKGDVQAIGEELTKIQAQNDGRLTVAVITKTASYKNSILHEYFEWNNSIAADKYRENQAGDLIRAIKVQYEISEDEMSEPIRAFVSIQDGDHFYQDIYTVMEDVNKRQQLFIKAMSELKAFTKKYTGFEEFEKLFFEINNLHSEALTLQ